jgi:hypothetical protein
MTHQVIRLFNGAYRSVTRFMAPFGGRAVKDEERDGVCSLTVVVSLYRLQFPFFDRALFSAP